jgi:hypothetical protein
MTQGDRVLAAIDELLAQQIKGAADLAWLRVSGGEKIDISVAKFMTVFDQLVDLHEKIRAAAADKFGVAA